MKVTDLKFGDEMRVNVKMLHGANVSVGDVLKFSYSQDGVTFYTVCGWQFAQNHIDDGSLTLLTQHEQRLPAVSVITKREQFAMAAMQGLMSSHPKLYTCQMLTEEAVMFADALIAELERSKNEEAE